jgi:(R,R)-butanediol dehydrogenase/meso-butanediol dehydrogenase/diacetyl reductase
MRAVILTNGRFTVETIADPTPAPHSVVIQVAACGICGTDHGLYLSRRLPDGSILGHEFAGTVVEVGRDVTGWQRGDRAAVVPIPYCGHCELCQGGNENLCRHGLRYTIGCGGAQGGMAEYALIDESSLRRLPRSFDVRFGALAEPMAVALHAVNLCAVKPGTRLGIIGLGPIGLFAGIVARLRGAMVFGFDVRPARVASAHALGLGAFTADDRADERIRDLTNGGPDVVIEASGHPESIERAATLARVGGRVVMVSSYHAPAEITPGHWVARGISLLPSIAYTAGEFAEAQEMIATNHIEAGRLITGITSLDSVQALFDRFETQSDAIKVLIDPSLHERREAARTPA